MVAGSQAVEHCSASACRRGPCSAAPESNPTGSPVEQRQRQPTAAQRNHAAHLEEGGIRHGLEEGVPQPYACVAHCSGVRGMRADGCPCGRAVIGKGRLTGRRRGRWRLSCVPEGCPRLDGGLPCSTRDWSPPPMPSSPGRATTKVTTKSPTRGTHLSRQGFVWCERCPCERVGSMCTGGGLRRRAPQRPVVVPAQKRHGTRDGARSAHTSEGPWHRAAGKAARTSSPRPA